MDDPTPLCQVCDASVMPGAPLALCVSCIAAAYHFAADCLPQELDEYERFREERCPWCGLLALVRNKRSGEVWCADKLNGCGRSVPALKENRERLLKTPQVAKERREVYERQVQRERDPAGPRVYYIRLGDAIKIGTSIDPDNRARALSLTPEHIVVTEPGTIVVERLRHKQFAHIRLHGEWFQATDELLAHIAELQRKAAAA